MKVNLLSVLNPVLKFLYIKLFKIFFFPFIKVTCNITSLFRGWNTDSSAFNAHVLSFITTEHHKN